MVSNESSLVVDTITPCGRAGPVPVPVAPSRANAMYSISQFRNRLGTGMNEIIPNLYLGSLRDATDAEQLKKHRIQYVVSVHDLTARHPAHEHLKVLKIQLSDCSSSDISSHFATTNRFIHAARMKHAAVLVHCLAGVSRSATVVAAYLITACDMSFLSALSLIAKKRPVINPNFGFRMQLCTYADRHAASERQSLREHFGALAFDAQWTADRAVTRSKIDWQLSALSTPPVVPSSAANTATSAQDRSAPTNGPSVPSTGTTAAPPRNGEVANVPVLPSTLPIQKVIARALPLPQSHRVQLLTLVHNPVLSEAGYIDE